MRNRLSRLFPRSDSLPLQALSLRLIRNRLGMLSLSVASFFSRLLLRRTASCQFSQTYNCIFLKGGSCQRRCCCIPDELLGRLKHELFNLIASQCLAIPDPGSDLANASVSRRIRRQGEKMIVLI